MEFLKTLLDNGIILNDKKTKCNKYIRGLNSTNWVAIKYSF